MSTFVYRVETEEPEWVPYRWTIVVEADSEEEAAGKAAALDGKVLAVEKADVLGNTDIENMDRIVNDVVLQPEGE